MIRTRRTQVSLGLDIALLLYCSILVVSCSMWSGALGSPDLLLPYSITSLSSHVTCQYTDNDPLLSFKHPKDSTSIVLGAIFGTVALLGVYWAYRRWCHRCNGGEGKGGFTMLTMTKLNLWHISHPIPLQLLHPSDAISTGPYLGPNGPENGNGGNRYRGGEGDTNVRALYQRMIVYVQSCDYCIILLSSYSITILAIKLESPSPYIITNNIL